jgi:hypothetical protein
MTHTRNANFFEFGVAARSSRRCARRGSSAPAVSAQFLPPFLASALHQLKGFIYGRLPRS